MRNLAIVFLLSISLAVGFHFLSRPRGLSEFAREVPRDSFALLIVNRIPHSFEFLSEIEWGELFELDQNDLQEGLEENFNGQFLSTFEEEVKGLAVVAYDLRRKESGEIRVAFIAKVLPKAGARTRLLALLEELILQRFGEGSSSHTEGNQTVYRGVESGEYLVVELTDSALTISNSEEAWEALTETRSGNTPGLGSRPAYQQILEEIDPRADLLLYVQGDGTWIPEFGYSIDRINSEKPETRYISAP